MESANVLEKKADFLHQQGWSYGLIRYLGTVTGEEVHQMYAHEGNRSFTSQVFLRKGAAPYLTPHSISFVQKCLVRKGDLGKKGSCGVGELPFLYF
jgi:hypothetical protein